MIEEIFPKDGARPRGPYSPAVRAGDFIFVAGQVPSDPVTNELSTGDIKHETRLALANLKRVLEAAGASPADVVRCNVYLADGGDFAAMNEVYAEFFGDRRPARTTVVVKFAADIKVEIDCIAYKPR
ncbi:MAG: RidA family protein [Bryobacteraceae bacterium]|jgi:endoribonuclease L-PSP, putative|nr:RidA family protein [Bryobacteraceae bacterium]